MVKGVWRAVGGMIAVLALGGHTTHAEEPGRDHRLRIATFNIEDVTPSSLAQDRARLERLGAVIRDVDPDIILLNEIAYAPVDAGKDGSALVGEAFAERFVDGPGVPTYRVFARPVNTGVASGFDLDHSGTLVNEPGARGYGGDCLGFGAFPGEYGMVVLVRHDLEILADQVRTFRTFLWRDMPDARLPGAGEAGGDAPGWYTDDMLAVLPLSSKSHWDVPVRMPDGRVLHVLASHPTPPVFDGPEDRNGKRNHDEIRFWREYIDGAPWIYDDAGTHGGLAPGALFVILGDQNADPDEGDSLGRPTLEYLLDCPRAQGDLTPRSTLEVDGLDADDTSRFKLRVDYVVPSVGSDVLGSGVVRGLEDLPLGRAELSRGRGQPVAWWEGDFPSDHFPVWVDIASGGAHGMGGGEMGRGK